MIRTRQNDLTNEVLDALSSNSRVNAHLVQLVTQCMAVSGLVHDPSLVDILQDVVLELIALNGTVLETHGHLLSLVE